MKNKKEITIRVQNREDGYCLYIGDYTVRINFSCCSIYSAMVCIITYLEKTFREE